MSSHYKLMCVHSSVLEQCRCPATDKPTQIVSCRPPCKYADDVNASQERASHSSIVLRFTDGQAEFDCVCGSRYGSMAIDTPNGLSLLFGMYERHLSVREPAEHIKDLLIDALASGNFDLDATVEQLSQLVTQPILPQDIVPPVVATPTPVPPPVAGPVNDTGKKVFGGKVFLEPPLDDENAREKILLAINRSHPRRADIAVDEVNWEHKDGFLVGWIAADDVDEESEPAAPVTAAPEPAPSVPLPDNSFDYGDGQSGKEDD